MATGTIVAVVVGSSLCWIIATPTAQFFLFCNVFRIRRFPELIWAGCYAVIVVVQTICSWPELVDLVAGFAVGALVIGLETRHPSYHGVMWQKFNPDLPGWYKRRTERSAGVVGNGEHGGRE